MFEPTELFYQVALTCIPQIGDVTAKKLITHFENASAIFNARRRELECLPEIGAVRAAAIKQFRNSPHTPRHSPRQIARPNRSNGLL